MCSKNTELTAQKEQHPFGLKQLKSLIIFRLNYLNFLGVSFDDILSYGRTMLYTLIDGNVDLDVLSTMWPTNWNDVQLLWKEEGFEDA